MAKDISRTLIIGLGGTGQSVIRNIKKRLFRRYGEIPALVKFLSFDTDNDDYQDTPFKYYYDGENRETKKYNLQKDEFKKIGRPGMDVLKDDPICKNLNYTELAKVYGLTNGIGANGFRIMGRAHLLYNSGEIMAMLNKVVGELRNANLLETERAVKGYNVANNNISVYVVASLAGGTGSSSFLDLSRMLQHAGVNVQPMGAQTQSDRIFGMFFMPSFFKDKPNTPNIQINTYVALSELDYTLGLNDRETYPIGCEALERDKNDYEGYNTYQPVRYSNVYLIDADTRKGHSHNFGEAAGYVASFIAASIAASAGALDSSYSNSTHCMHNVDGKKQLYSGLGYCEIRLDRQNLVRYLINRQIREILSAYKEGDESMKVDQLVDKFIEDNQLNEGVMSQEEGMEDTRANLNELTDSIFVLNDKQFTKIVMGKVQTGKEAASNIENNKVKYLNNLGTAAGEAINNFALKKKQLLGNLKTKLNEFQTQKGFGKFPDIAKRMKNSLTNMKLGLEDEVLQHQNMINQLENDLRKIKNQIDENKSTGFLGIGNKTEAQSAAIKSYNKKVELLSATENNQTLGSLKLEISRKDEAIAIYDEMIDIIDSYYKEEEIETGTDKKRIQISGSSLDVQQIYDALKGLVDSENDSYKPSKAAKNETIFADAYFKDYFENHKTEAFELTEQNRIDIEDRINNIFVNQPKIDNDLLGTLREFLLGLLPEDVRIKRIQRNQLSLDELFIDCFGKAGAIADDHDHTTYPQLGLFGQLDALFDSLWQYKEFKGSNSIPVARQCVVGVFNTDFHILDRNNGYESYLPNTHSYQYINLGDPDRIVFMLQETAIPAFKMKEADVWTTEYNKKKKTTYSYTDMRMENIDLISPEKLNEEGDIAWAYGWMFGLIANVNGRIQVKPSGAYMSREKRVKGNTGYYDYFKIKSQKSSDLNACHRLFIRDEELFDDIYNQAMTLLDGDKAGQIVRICHWVNDDEIWQNRGKLRTSMLEDERLVIQNEPQYLAKRFERLNSGTLSISYDVNTLKVKYDDSLGVLAQREQEYQQAKQAKKTEE